MGLETTGINRNQLKQLNNLAYRKMKQAEQLEATYYNLENTHTFARVDKYSGELEIRSKWET